MRLKGALFLKAPVLEKKLDRGLVLGFPFVYNQGHAQETHRYAFGVDSRIAGTFLYAGNRGIRISGC